MGLVVGIFPSSDAKALQDALTGQSAIDNSKVRVVTKNAPSQDEEDYGLDFVQVYVAQEHNSLSDEMTRGTGIMSDSGGTGVPGLGGSSASLTSLVGHGGSANYLAGAGIPEDEVDNYNGAITEGRSVVLYTVDGDAGAASTALKSAGLLHVRSY